MSILYEVEKLTVITLATEFGTHLSTREIWGQKVFAKITALLEMEYSVQVSFADMKAVSVSFLDEAFGKLAEVYSIEFLKKHLSFTEISDHHRANLNRAIMLRLQRKSESQAH